MICHSCEDLLQFGQNWNWLGKETMPRSWDGNGQRYRDNACGKQSKGEARRRLELALKGAGDWERILDLNHVPIKIFRIPLGLLLHVTGRSQVTVASICDCKAAPPRCRQAGKSWCDCEPARGCAHHGAGGRMGELLSPPDCARVPESVNFPQENHGAAEKAKANCFSFALSSTPSAFLLFSLCF